MNIVERLKDSLEYEYNLSFSERKQLLEEINRLNNIIEINRLNNIINELSKDVDMWNKKYNEQFNIINELEKYIGQEWYCFDNESIEFKVARDILDKLKELKEE